MLALSLSLFTSSPSFVPTPHPQTESRLQLCQDAANIGTYLAAAAEGRKHVVLSLVGGGVFGNPLGRILRAIARAHKLSTGVSADGKTRVSSIEKVTLALWGHDPVAIKDALVREGIPAIVTVKSS